MGRTQHTNDIIPRSQAEVDKINSDGSLPPGVKVVPYYDRTSLVGVTTHTVLHNLVFGCLLVFIIQWMFLGDLRSAHHRRRQHSVRAVLRHHHPGAAGRGRQSAVARRGRFRHHRRFRRDHDGEHLSATSSRRPDSRQPLLQHLAEGYWGADPTAPDRTASRASAWTDRLRMIFVSALQVDKAVFFTAAITVTAFVPLFTMQGVEGQIFGPMARTYGYALAGALLATFTVTPVLASLLLPKHIEETETAIVRALAPSLYAGAALGARQRRSSR